MSKPHPDARTVFTLWTLSACAWLLGVAYFATARGQLDFSHYALGRDFLIPWTGGHMALSGNAVSVFDPNAFMVGVRRWFDPTFKYPHFWSYPPTYLLLAAPLGLAPYIPAYIAWNVAGLILLGLAGWRFFDGDRTALLLLVTSPAVVANVILGQNGFITGALLIGAAAVLRRRPAWAGVLFGLLTFKPQFGVVAPVAVVAAQRWRTVLVALIVAAAFAAASVACFGLGAWRAFFSLAMHQQTLMMTRGVGPFVWMATSPYMAGRVLHLPPTVDVAIQGAFIALGVWFAWRAFRRESALAPAVLLATTLLSAPLSFEYDLAPLMAAALVLLRESAAPADRAVGTLAWSMPLLGTGLNATGLPIVPLVIGALAWRLDHEAIAARRPR